MKKLDVVVIECGLDYMDRVGVLEKRCETVEEAIWAVTALGYEVIPNDKGGENVAYEDHIVITVSPPVLQPELDVYKVNSIKFDGHTVLDHSGWELVETIVGITEEDCLEQARIKYGDGDYHWTYPRV